MSSFDQPHPESPIDVAIVGGGIAGLYTAYLLVTNPTTPPMTVHLFEAQKRLGGRLHSIKIPRVLIPAELGAMRYNDQRHKKLVSLIEELGINTFKFDVGEVTSYYLRGRRFLRDHLNKSSCTNTGCAASINFCQECGTLLDPPYVLRPELRDTKIQTPDDLIRFAITAALNDLEFPTAQNKEGCKRREEELLALKQGSTNTDNWHFFRKYGELKYNQQVKGIPLASTGFWNLLEHYLGNEGFLLAHDGLGYESIVGNWNAAEAMEWFASDIGTNTSWGMLRNGYQDLCEKLEEKIRGGHGTIRLEQPLVHLSKLADTWRLDFERADGTKAKIPTVYARHVILALPAEPLKLLSVNYSGWDYRFKKSMLSSVRQHRMFKVFLVYKKKWWHNRNTNMPGSHSGRVFTDLPIRQVYYYSPEWISNHVGVDHTDKQAQSLPIIMASYSDSHYVTFWQPFLGAPGTPVEDSDFEQQLQKFRDFCKSSGHQLNDEEDEQLQALKPFLVPSRMCDKIRQQLAELHGVELTKIPPPVFGVYKSWGLEGYDVGGWHTWEVNSTEDIITNIVHPFPTERLYICGEAYSTHQGWVEGALDSATEVVKELKQTSS